MFFYRSFFSIIVVLFFSRVYAQKDTSKVGKKFCIQTFNTYGPIYSFNLKKRTTTLLTLLDGYKPCDIMLFQEVWQEEHYQYFVNSHYSNNISKSDNLNKKTNYKSGLMTISSIEPIKATIHYYENNYIGFMDLIRKLLNVKKAVVKLKFNTVVKNKELLVLNTHLHHKSMKIRMLQLKQINEIIKKNKPTSQATILVGDFNIVPFSQEYNYIVTTMGFVDSTSKYPQNYCTYCTKNSLSWLANDFVFDYIFYKSANNLELVLLNSPKLILNNNKEFSISDHYGLRAFFMLRDLDFKEVKR